MAKTFETSLRLIVSGVSLGVAADRSQSACDQQAPKTKTRSRSGEGDKVNFAFWRNPLVVKSVFALSATP
jgi:hypothetical protein